MEKLNIICVQCSCNINNDNWEVDLSHNFICTTCHDEKYDDCNRCNNYFNINEDASTIGITVDEMNGYCIGCFKIHYKKCKSCDIYHKTDDTIYRHQNEERFCLRCYDNMFYQCYDCGESDYLTTDHEEFNGCKYCIRCYQDNFRNCDVCSTTVRRGDGHSNRMHDHLCRECWEAGVLIHSYSYRPKAQFFKRFDKENLFFGIELEVERNNSSVDIDAMVKKLKTVPNFYFKQDGSLNHGFEIVSHPMSYEYIKTNQEIFKNLLSELSLKEYKSYESTTCGMHIHLSKNAFKTWHLYRFMKFFKDNKDLILNISQRNEPFFKRWSSIGEEEFNEKNLRFKMKQKRSQSGARYQAVNLENDKTVEVRIFRGTLKFPTFMKNIEFTHSIYEFTKNNNKDDIRLDNYFQFIQNYKYLNNFLKDKKLCV